MKILIICTGNTCRSQMAEGFLRSFASQWEIFSAGTRAEEKVNPYAVEVMKELGIDIHHQKPNSIADYLHNDFDYVITVCDGAKEICPVFTGRVKHRLHLGFDDPAAARGSADEVLPVYRKIRDQIKEQFFQLYQNIQNGKKP